MLRTRRGLTSAGQALRSFGHATRQAIVDVRIPAARTEELLAHRQRYGVTVALLRELQCRLGRGGASSLPAAISASAAHSYCTARTTRRDPSSPPSPGGGLVCGR